MTTDVAKKYQDKLPGIKKAVQQWHAYFKDNYDRFNEFRKFVFISSISDTESTLLKAQMRPILEFNVLEAYVSRLRGEFSKQEPAIEVSSKDGSDTDPELIEVVENHMRYILSEANKQGLEYNCYTDTLTGGFSAIKVFTDYTSEMSFHQDIFAKRVYDPCMTGFDPMANRDDKSDGAYCFELFPRRKEEFLREFTDKNLDGVGFSRDIGGFSWSYQTDMDEILLLCDYYEKKIRHKNIVLLTDGQVMTTDDYKKFVEDWEMQGIIAQVPQVVGKPRKTEITTICRYKLIENQVLEYEETELKQFPLIFVDGNSVLTRGTDGSAVKQMTRPYVYNARGAQKLKNFSGQCLANELENMVQHKWVAPLDGIPPEYKDAYKNVQTPSVLVYNAFKDDDPNIPLPPPQAIQRPEIPQEISGTFQMTDQIVQNVLGSFDASLGRMTTNEMSGIALQETITLGNSAAMPYVVSFLRGLQSAAQRILELIPLYYTTPRTIPVMDAQGKKSYVKINQDGGVSFDYDQNAIQVKVEAGVSFGVQQSKALNQIIALMNSSEMFAQFINDSGLDIILENVEIRGIEQLKERAEVWMQQQQEQAAIMAQQQQMAMEAEANKPNIEMMALDIAAQQVEAETMAAQEKIDLEQRKLRSSTMLDIGQLNLDKKKLEVELVKILAQKEESDEKNRIARTKEEIAAAAKATDFALKSVAMQHARKDKSAERALKFHTAQFPKKKDRLKQELENSERKDG